MYLVKCPVCGETRQVKARKSWMIGEEPYIKLCKKHAGGKEKTDEHRRKLSESVKKTQTIEVLERKRQFMLQHPELWVDPQSDLGHEAWRGKHHTDESKKLISEGVKKAKTRINNNE